MAHLTIQGKFGLVIPTLNEAGNIPNILRKVQEVLFFFFLNYEVIIVDDDSHDGTGEIVAKHAETDGRIKLLTRKGKRGLAGAILSGWQFTDADLLGVMDADFQHPPELLRDLLAAMSNGADLAIGSRYVRENGTAGWNPARRLISSAGTWITLPLQHRAIRVKDPLSGFFVVRRSCIDGIPFHQQGFKLLLEILVRARIAHVTEVPFHFGVRRSGRSKANIRVAMEYFALLGRLSREAILRTSPQ